MATRSRRITDGRPKEEPSLPATGRGGFPYLKHFRQLAEEFEEQREATEARLARQRQTLKRCRNEADLRKHFAEWTVAALLRCRTAAELFRDPDVAMRHAADACADYVGLELIPRASRLVVRALQGDVLEEPAVLWRRVRLDAEALPEDDNDHVRFWRRSILPALEQHAPERFVGEEACPMERSGNHARACALLADILEASAPPHPPPTAMTTEYAPRPAIPRAPESEADPLTPALRRVYNFYVAAARHPDCPDDTASAVYEFLKAHPETAEEVGQSDR